MRKPQEAEAIGCEEAGGRWTRRWRPSWTLQTSTPMGSYRVGLRPMARSGLSSSRAASTWRQLGLFFLFFLLISSRHLSSSIPLTASLLTLSKASSSSCPPPHLQFQIVPQPSHLALLSGIVLPIQSIQQSSFVTHFFHQYIHKICPSFCIIYLENYI